MSRSRFFRRTRDRHKVSIRGKIIIKANVCWSIECLIVELSLDGATAELDETYDLPEEIMLFECHSGNIYHCKLLWQNKEAVGVGFIDMCNGLERRALIRDRSLGLLKPGETRGPLAEEAAPKQAEEASE